MTAIFGGLADELEKVRSEFLLIKDSILPDEMDVQFVPDWESRFKLPEANLTEQERRDRLTAQWLSRGGRTREFLETQLRDAGFDVYVKVSVYTATGSQLGDIILGDSVLEGDVVTGQKLAVDPCSLLIPGGTLGDFVLGDGQILGLNRPKLIKNYIDESLDLFDFCPLDPGRYNFVFYVQGPGELGDLADVPAARYSEFRETVLRFKPASSWIMAFINLV